MGMKNFSILEAVEVALMMEEEGIRFYALAEQKAGVPEMKKLFSFLRDKEHQHIETFRRLYSDLAAREGNPDAELWLLDTEVSSYFRAYVDTAVFPARGIRALGCVYVCGLSFVPAPATGIIDFIAAIRLIKHMKLGKKF